MNPGILIAALLVFCIAGCNDPARQQYTSDGAPILPKDSLAHLKPEGSVLPDRREVERKGDCTVTSVVTEAPGQRTFLTRFTDCRSAPRESLNKSIKMLSDSTTNNEGGRRWIR
jgi:hypothetical protein